MRKQLFMLSLWGLAGLLCPPALRAAHWVTGDETGSSELGQSPAIERPVFPSTTIEAVLLRYRLKRDQVLNIVDDINTDIQMGIGPLTLNMAQNIRIEAKARITEVDLNGNISALVKITRLKMKMSGVANAEFDSDKPDDANPDFKAVTAMIGVGIPCKISPVGELLETDLEPLRLAVRRVNNAALQKALEDSTTQMFEGTFIQLSKDPIAAGQTYRAGTILSDKMKMQTSYKIASVNSEKSKVIMEPIVVMELPADAIPDADMKIIGQETTGWMLFDREKGYPTEGQMNSHVVMELTADGQQVRMDTKTIGLSRTTVE